MELDEKKGRLYQAEQEAGADDPDRHGWFSVMACPGTEDQKSDSCLNASPVLAFGVIKGLPHQNEVDAEDQACNPGSMHFDIREVLNDIQTQAKGGE